MTTMKVIIPVPVNDTTFVSSTELENDHPVWVTGTSYTANTSFVIKTTGLHRRYKCKQTHNSSTAGSEPGVGASWQTYWDDIGPTNRWAMFDEAIGTATSGTNSITVVLRPGKPIGGLTVIGASAASWSLTMTDQNGTGPNTYTDSGFFDTYDVDDWYEYMAAPIRFNSDLVRLNLPLYTDPRITFTITGTGPVSIGVLIVGGVISLGAPLYGMTLGMRDFSKKDVSEEGVTTLTQGKFSRRVDVKLQCDQSSMNSIYALMSNLRATPCVWVPVGDSGYESSVVYGWFRDFSLDLAQPSMFYTNLQLEGLT